MSSTASSRWATWTRRQFSFRPSPSSSRARISSAPRRPAPAKPPRSCFRCSRLIAEHKPKGPRILVLEPTRELAGQVDQASRDYSPLRQPAHHGRLWWRRLRRPGNGAQARRRRPRRHSRPAARLHRKGHDFARARRAPRPRRGRPHARHGLHARRSPHHRILPEGTPDAPLLRHHAARDRQAHRVGPARSREDRDRRPALARGDGDARALSRRHFAEVRPAPRNPRAHAL